jgi:hypothetical protein
MEDAASRLGRQVNPLIYTRQELAKRNQQGNAFVARVWQQPKIWLVGDERGLGA